MKVGILVPLSQELNSLTKTRITTGSSIRLSENTIACLTGIGRENTRKGFHKLLTQGVELLLSWGSAAGLGPDVSAGDLLIPVSVKTEHQVYPTSTIFNHMLMARLPQTVSLYQGSITETRKILASVKDKYGLFESSGCQAADMESGALAELAAENNIPFSVIRSVSDAAGTALPATLLSSFKDGSFRPLMFLRKSLVRPGEWFVITKLFRDFKKAEKSLNIAGDIVKTYSPQWT